MTKESHKKPEETVARQMAILRNATAFIHESEDRKRELLHMLALYPELNLDNFAAKLDPDDPRGFAELKSLADKYRRTFESQIQSIIVNGLLEASGQDHAGLFPVLRDELFTWMFIERSSAWQGSEFLCLPVIPERAVSCWKQLQLLEKQGWEVGIFPDLKDGTLTHRYEDDAREVYWLSDIRTKELRKARPANRDEEFFVKDMRSMTLAEGIALVRHYGDKLPTGVWRLHGSRINDNHVPALKISQQGKALELVSEYYDETSSDGEPDETKVPVVSTRYRYP